MVLFIGFYRLDKKHSVAGAFLRNLRNISHQLNFSKKFYATDSKDKSTFKSNYPAKIYPLKVNNKNTRKRC